MKSYFTIPATIALCSALFVVNTLAGDNTSAKYNRFTAEKLTQIEANLVAALESDMPSMQTSASIVLKQVKLYAPEYKFSETIIPLMHIVKDEDCDVTCRLAAALSLHELRSARGDFAIKQTGKFTDVERIRQVCLSLTAIRQLEN